MPSLAGNGFDGVTTKGDGLNEQRRPMNPVLLRCNSATGSAMHLLYYSHKYREKEGYVGRHYDDLTGKEVNGVKVIRIVENSGGAGKCRMWVCECPLCKREYTVRKNNLMRKKTPYCVECADRLLYESIREDLTGQKFGHLRVDQMIYPGELGGSNKRTICYCTCDCGTSGVMVQANHLKSGETKSCGCMLSFPEEQIASILTDNGINFTKQKKFDGLKYKHILRFDFYLPDRNLVIEYNGLQHYEPIKHYGGEEDFKKRQERDRIKREYCAANNIEYIVIKYNEDIEDTLKANNIINEEIV